MIERETPSVATVTRSRSVRLETANMDRNNGTMAPRVGAPVIDNLAFDGATGDRVQFFAIVTYPNDGGTVSAYFQGSASGCAPVMMSTNYGRDWVRVVDAERFGSAFGREWIRRFFA